MVTPRTSASSCSPGPRGASTARKVGFGADAETLIGDLVAHTPAVVAQVGAALPSGFSQVVADTVLGGLLRAAQALEAMPA